MKDEERKMILSLEAYNVKYSVEVDDDITWTKLTEEYLKLLQSVGYILSKDTFIDRLKEGFYND